MRFLFFTIATIAVFGCSNNESEAVIVNFNKDSAEAIRLADSIHIADSLALREQQADTNSSSSAEDFLAINRPGGLLSNYVEVSEVGITYTKKFKPVLAFTVSNVSDKTIDAFTITIRTGTIPEYQKDVLGYFSSECVINKGVEKTIEPNGRLSYSIEIDRITKCGESGFLWINRVHFPGGTVQESATDWNQNTGYKF